LFDPTGLVFGPNGNLFVSSGNSGVPSQSDQVLEYNGTTGAFLTAFVTPGSGGLKTPTFLTFGPASRIPEPGTGVLVGLGGLLLFAYARRSVRCANPDGA
jgi:hypothetical protein